MTTETQRKDFIGFILDAEKSEELTREFLAQREPKGLYAFFQKNGYDEILLSDCDDILTAEQRLGDVVELHHVAGECEGKAKY